MVGGKRVLSMCSSKYGYQASWTQLTKENGELNIFAT